MSKKKIILISVAVIAVAAVGFFLLRKDPTTPPVVNDPGKQTVVGGYSGKLFNIVKDPAKPFAENAPRSPEPTEDVAYKEKPAVTPGTPEPSTKDEEYKKQVALGLVPDENGYYTQVIHPSGTNQWQANQTNYNLDWNNFINQYYPNYQDIIDGQTEGQLAGKKGESLVIDNTPAQQLPTTIADVPSVESSRFQTSSDNSQANIRDYLQRLNQAKADFDLINDENTVSTSLGSSDLALVRDYQSRSLAAIGRITTVRVPTSMLGLSKSYVLLYQSFGTVMQDQIDMVNAGSDNTRLVNILQRYESDAGKFVAASELAQLNTEIAASIAGGNN